MTPAETFVEQVKPSARVSLLDAALMLIRKRGFVATSVDELCREAGVTKGAFFHHFRSKEDLGISAADYWSETTGRIFESAAYTLAEDPLDRVLGYIDFRTDLLQGDVCQFTCLAGTMVQEVFESFPAIRDACKRSIFDHASILEADIAAAMHLRGMTVDWDARSLALHTQAVLQGAFILAKASNSPAIAVESARHLRRYVECLFHPKNQGQK